MDWLDRLEPLIELVVHFRARIQRSDTWTQRTRNGLSNGSNKEIGDEVLKGKMGGGRISLAHKVSPPLTYSSASTTSRSTITSRASTELT